MKKSVRKAIILAECIGIRFLPTTKLHQKEIFKNTKHINNPLENLFIVLEKYRILEEILNI